MTPAEQDPARELVARAPLDPVLAEMVTDLLMQGPLRVHGRGWAEREARRILLVLADRLLPAGGEERTQWGEACAPPECPRPHEMCCYDEAPRTHEHSHRRTVTEWPDGSTYTTGWVEVGTDEH